MSLSFDEWLPYAKSCGFLNSDDDEVYQNYYYTIKFKDQVVFKDIMLRELQNNSEQYKMIFNQVNYKKINDFSNKLQLPAEYIAGINYIDFRSEIHKYFGIDTQDFFIDSYVNDKDTTENQVFVDITQHLMHFPPGFDRAREMEKIMDKVIQLTVDNLPKMLQTFFVVRFISFMDSSQMTGYPEIMLKIEVCKQMFEIYHAALQSVVDLFNEVRQISMLTYGTFKFIIENVEDFQDENIEWFEAVHAYLTLNRLHRLASIIVPTV